MSRCITGKVIEIGDLEHLPGRAGLVIEATRAELKANGGVFGEQVVVVPLAIYASKSRDCDALDAARDCLREACEVEQATIELCGEHWLEEDRTRRKLRLARWRAELGDACKTCGGSKVVATFAQPTGKYIGTRPCPSCCDYPRPDADGAL